MVGSAVVVGRGVVVETSGSGVDGVSKHIPGGAWSNFTQTY